MPQVLISGLPGGTRCYQITEFGDAQSLKEWLEVEIEEREGVPAFLQHLRVVGGATGSTSAAPWINAYVNLGLNGGKGGFGTLLRAGGGNKNVPVNNDSSRDLEGRRLRDANALTKIQKALDKKQAALNGEEVPDSDSEDETNKRRKKHHKKKQRHSAKEEPLSAISQTNEDKYKLKQRKEEELRQTHRLVVEETTDAVATGFEAASEKQLHENAFSAPKSIISVYGDIYGVESSSEDSSDSEESSSEEAPKLANPSAPSAIAKQAPASSKSAQKQALASSSTQLPQKQSAPAAPAQDLDKRDGVKRTHAEMATTSMVDLMKYDSSVALEALGLERLKQELDARGLLIGGNLTQRAVRLFQVRGLTAEQYPPELLSKSKKAKVQ